MKRGGALLAFCVSCSANAPQDEPIRIFAAASLTDALSAVAEQFTQEHPASPRIVPQYGSSSDLARQILAGAPADLFFSADTRQLDRVSSSQLIDENGRADILSNTLVVVGRRETTGAVEGPEDLRKRDRIALADPEAVPAGVYAREYLERHALWSDLESRIVPTLDVRGALAAVASGNVDVGFVYRTDAAIEERVRILYAVPRDQGPTILYSLGIIASHEREDVRRFYDYLTSSAAGDVFERFGFIVLHDESARH